jgi:hypothetical protein
VPWYNKAKYEIFKGNLALLDSTIKVLLVGPTTVFDPDDAYVSDLNVGEITGTGYVSGFGASGRKALQGKAFVEDDATDVVYFDGSDLIWTGINAGTVAAAVLVREMSSDADSLLIAFIAFDNVSTYGGDLIIEWATEGILRVT